MKSHELLSIPLNEKVYVTEVYQDRSSDLIAVGLRSSVVILNLKIEESESTGPIVQYEIVQSVRHSKVIASQIMCNSHFIFVFFCRSIMIHEFNA
jgi:hypothetical protein